MWMYGKDWLEVAKAFGEIEESDLCSLDGDEEMAKWIEDVYFLEIMDI